MNPTLFFATVLATFAASAQAGWIYIYSPYSATVCTAGQPCPITWDEAHDGPEFERVNIELLSGDANNATVVAPIVLGYPLSDGNMFIWDVPANIPSNADTFVRISGVGTDYSSYSHRFEVNNPAIPITTTTSSVAPTSTSSSSASSMTSSSSAHRTSMSPSATASSSAEKSAKVSLSAVAALAVAAAMFMF